MTIEPAFCASMIGSASCITNSAPKRLTRSIASRSAPVMSATGAGSSTPALLTTTSMRPKRAFASAKQARTSSRFVTSAGSTAVSPPASRATSSSAARRRATSATRAPAAAKASATARPMPLDAPVTSTVWSRKSWNHAMSVKEPKEHAACQCTGGAGAMTTRARFPQTIRPRRLPCRNGNDHAQLRVPPGPGRTLTWRARCSLTWSREDA